MSTKSLADHIREMGDKEHQLETITKWKHAWMDEPDYFDRAFNIDSNMKHHLADTIAKANRPLVELAAQMAEALEFYAAMDTAEDFNQRDDFGEKARESLEGARELLKQGDGK